MTRIPGLTLAGILAVCITVGTCFTLRDLARDKRDVDQDSGSVEGRVEDKVRGSHETPEHLRFILKRGDEPSERDVEDKLTQGNLGLKEISRELSDRDEHALYRLELDIDSLRKLRRKNLEYLKNKIRRIFRRKDGYFKEDTLERKVENRLNNYINEDRKLTDSRRLWRSEITLHHLPSRSEAELNSLRSREGGSVDEDRPRQQVDGQIGRLISSGTGRGVSTTSVTAGLGTDSLSRKPAQSQLSLSLQVNNREVNPKHSQHGSDYRLLHQRRLEDSKLFPVNLETEVFPKQLEERERFNFEERRVKRDEYSVFHDEGNELGRSEALAQEVSKVSDHPNTVPKMVVVATTTVAALFGMCVMAAIFQCCCRRKRAGSDSEPVDGVKGASSEKKSSKSPSPDKDINKQDAEKTENDKLLEDEDLGDFSAVQRETEILKSFRKPPPPKNRARASRVPRMKAAASSEDAFSLIKEEAEGSIKSKSSSRRNSPEKKDQNGEKKSEEASSPEALRKEEKISSTEATKELIEPPKEDKRLSFEAAKQLVDSMFAEVREKGEKLLMSKGETTLGDKEETTLMAPEPEEKTKEKETANVNGVSAMEGNIFMQIDPTVKIEDPSEKKTSRIPVRATPSSPSSDHKQEASLRPTSANKDQRKFLVPSVHGEQMDQLVKSLKTKLKEDKGKTCLSDRNLATSKAVNPGNEDGLEPVERERSHSDPTKKLLGVKATHV